jgi:hypothetical protein
LLSKQEKKEALVPKDYEIQQTEKKAFQRSTVFSENR